MNKLLYITIALSLVACNVQVPKDKATKVNCKNKSVLQCTKACVNEEYYSRAYTLADRVLVCESKCKTCEKMKNLTIGF